jgi:hypothetical protein
LPNSPTCAAPKSDVNREIHLIQFIAVDGDSLTDFLCCVCLLCCVLLYIVYVVDVAFVDCCSGLSTVLPSNVFVVEAGD